jgi:PAS domain-containing protein
MIISAEELLAKADSAAVGEKPGSPEGVMESGRQKTLLKTGALQDAIFNSAYFSSIATDEKGVIQIFNVGAERMLGYAAVDVVNLITPADISDPQELIKRAAALSLELDTPYYAGLRGAGVQGFARHRRHLRADLHPQGRQPLPRSGVGHGTA